jgi:hypothetical protein
MQFLYFVYEGLLDTDTHFQMYKLTLCKYRLNPATFCMEACFSFFMSSSSEQKCHKFSFIFTERLSVTCNYQETFSFLILTYK